MKDAKQPIANTVHEDNGGEKVQEIALAFDTAFQEVDDPKTKTGAIDYLLAEILFTSLVAVCCGAKSFSKIETFGEEQLSWLTKCFPFKNGTPSNDTFTRVFELLDYKSLGKAYPLLIEGLKIRDKKHIAIDGKTSRGCYIIKGQYLLHGTLLWLQEGDDYIRAFACSSCC